MILPLLKWNRFREARALRQLAEYENLTGSPGRFTGLPWPAVTETTGLTPVDLAAFLQPLLYDLRRRREVRRLFRETRAQCRALGFWPEFRPVWREALRAALAELGGNVGAAPSEGVRP